MLSCSVCNQNSESTVQFTSNTNGGYCAVNILATVNKLQALCRQIFAKFTVDKNFYTAGIEVYICSDYSWAFTLSRADWDNTSLCPSHILTYRYCHHLPTLEFRYLPQLVNVRSKFLFDAYIYYIMATYIVISVALDIGSLAIRRNNIRATWTSQVKMSGTHRPQRLSPSSLFRDKRFRRQKPRTYSR